MTDNPETLVRRAEGVFAAPLAEATMTWNKTSENPKPFLKLKLGNSQGFTYIHGRLTIERFIKQVRALGKPVPALKDGDALEDWVKALIKGKVYFAFKRRYKITTIEKFMELEDIQIL